MSVIKSYLKWIILGITFYFILNTTKNHWQGITGISLNSQGWLFLFIALIITCIAHIWSGLVWIGILRNFQQFIGVKWGLEVYLITNIYKYLPGNIGHFYGRIAALSKKEVSLSIASLSVLLEPLLMAAAALFMAILSHGIGLIETSQNGNILLLQILALISILMGIHPLILNRVINFTKKLKSKTRIQSLPVYLKNYPGFILLGELGFLLLRGAGFIFVFIAFTPIDIQQSFRLLSAFSLAWLLGLIIPGAPGGIGVFEATMIAILEESTVSIEILLAAIAIFRIISILAEVIGASLAYLTRTSL